MPAPQVITFIIGSIVVIFGAYFATYLVARGSQRAYRGRLIQVLDRFSLAKDKTLALIAVYDRIYLVAFAAGNITLLDSIDPETASALAADCLKPEEKPRQPANFAEALYARWGRRFSKKAAQAGLGMQASFEAYLPREVDNPNTPESFLGILQSRLEKEERQKEEQRQ